MGFWKGKLHNENNILSSDGWRLADAQSDNQPSTSNISKPFNSMIFDELLEALPNCSPEVINELWIPEMRKKFTELKGATYAIQSRSLDSYGSLMTMDKVNIHAMQTLNQANTLMQDLRAIAEDAKRIPLLYDQVLKEAGELSEMTIDTFKREMDGMEDQLADLTAENGHLRAEAKLRFKEATAEKYNVYALIDSVRPVLEEALRHPQHWERVPYENMLQVLQDYPADQQQPEVETLRLPQQTYHQLIADLREAQDTITTLRGVAGEQAQLIKEQSSNLTEDLDRYEHVVESLHTRNHEVLLLDDRNKELEETLLEREASLKQGRMVIEELNDELAQIREQHDACITEKDIEISKMRWEFDQVQEKLLIAQIDLRNAQTRQALDAADDGFNKPRPGLPNSYSSFALNVRQLTEQAESRPQQIYRILGPRTDLAEAHHADLVVTHSPSATQSLTQPVYPRRLSDPFQDYSAAERARAASLDSEKFLVRRPNDGAKPLPSPPTISPTIPSSAALGESCNGLTTAHEVSRASPQFHMRDLHGPETPGSSKRILSIIAEASQEGSSSLKSFSATSSEKNDYRNSMSALELLDGQSSPLSNGNESPVMHASWADGRRRQYPRSVGLRDLDVSKMYHHDRQHL